MTCVIVCCSEIADKKWRWIEGSFDPKEAIFRFVPCVPRYRFEQNRWLNLARMRGSYRAVRVAQKNNARALVTHGPTVAVWCCFFAAMTGLKVPILAHTFNFTIMPNWIKRSFFAKALRRADRFVVFSTMERKLYSELFDLPFDRFDVVRWAVRRPTVDSPRVPLQSGAYVSAIGGNARDYRTLLGAAAELAHIQFVLVARPENLFGLNIPRNVRVYENLPGGMAMNVLFNSRFMVLPLSSCDVAAGHVTLVAAMHLQKAVIVTDVPGVRDYIEPGENAITTPLASATDLAANIKLLWEDELLCARLAENGQRFAIRECSEEHITEHFRRWLLTDEGAPNASDT